MPELAFIIHERFARYFVLTRNVSYAYRMSFGEQVSPDDAPVLGAAVMEIPEVADRIAELNIEQYENGYASLEIGERRAFLGSIVRTPLCNVDANSKICHSWKRTYGKDGALLSEQVKMPDKFRALALDMKLAEEEERLACVKAETIYTYAQFEERLKQARA